MEYLQNPRFLDQQHDFFKQRIIKSDITKLATSLIKCLFPSAQDNIDHVEAEVTNQELEPEPDQPANLGQQFELFMRRDRFAQPTRRAPATTTDLYSKIVEKEM